MIKNLLTLTLIFLSFSVAFSVVYFKGNKKDKSVDLTGEWTIGQIKITSLSEDNTITEDNCFWAEAKASNKPIVFDESGKVTIYKMQEGDSYRDQVEKKVTETTVSYRVSGNELQFIFKGGKVQITGADGIVKESEGQSSTSYEFSIDKKHTQFTLTRNDGIVSEEYIFIKN